MSVTVKIDEQANGLLEMYLGWQRAQSASQPKGRRIDKEDITSEAVRFFVTEKMPAKLVNSIIKPAETKP